MPILHRIWTGIVAAVAGAALALVLQVAGQMSLGLPPDTLTWLLAVFMGGGFLLGVLIGPRRTTAERPEEQ